MNPRDAAAGQALLSALVERDTSTLQDLLHPDVVCNVPGAHVHSGVYKGKGEVLTYVAGVWEMADDSITFHPHDIAIGDDHVVLLATVTGSRKGKGLEQQMVIVMHIEEGLIREVWLHPGDQHSLDEFWA